MNLNKKLFSITDKGKDYEKYKEFIYSPWKSGIKSKTVYMRAAGWTMLLEEALSACIEQELGLKYLGNRIWATDYNNHYRKVFGLFLVNDSCATFKWGLNFDFVPVAKNSGTKACYARTDKSIQYHVFEVPIDFYECTKKRPYTIIDAFDFNLDNFNKSVRKKINAYQKAFEYVLPDIKTFYESTSDYDKTLQFIIEQRKNTYYNFVNNELVFSQIFIEYYLGDTDTALKHFSELKFNKEVLCEAFYKKLLLTPSQQR